MKKACFVTILSMLLLLQGAPLRASDYAVGADLSFLKQAEDHGKVFRDNGAAKPGLEIFKDHGYNWIRLRLFHTPVELPNNLEYTMALAKAAKKLGFHFLLDYHYSDTWADPGKQFLPKAWEGMSHVQLVKAVFEYTKQTISAFREAGVLPDMVQIGNEVINGMLWPDGRLPRNWDNFADVVEAAYNWMPAEYKKRPGPFPESPEGQKQFLEEVNRVVQETPDGLGKGLFWWEPAVTGPLGSRGFFDDTGNALPVITTFDKYTRH